jgi:hypothetical protein
MTTNFVKLALESKGSIANLTINANKTNGLSLTNPSIFYDGINLMCNIRYVEYALYHSENEQKFQNQWGVLAYLHPEDDIHLRTKNAFTKNLENDVFEFIDTTNLDREPLWDFIGLEDARIVVWDGKTYLCGVRRDTTTNGVGRMELSEIYDGREINRYRIEPPNGYTYCEKNWMPIVDMPFHFVKWSNPTEVVKVNILKGTSETILLKNQTELKDIKRDLRGGSQVIPFKDFHIALTHEVDLWNNEKGNKDGQYYHRFIVWDKDWNVIKKSDEFKFLGANIEFCCGMAIKDDEFLITFGFQDTTSFLLSVPCEFVEQYIGLSVKKEVENYGEVILTNTLNNFAYEPKSGTTNFAMGCLLYNQNHFSSALSFFLRCAEYGSDEDLIYEALLLVSKCLGHLGRRKESEKTALLNAISFAPKRYEGYYYLSQYYEQKKDYFNCYTMAKISQSNYSQTTFKMLPNIEAYKVDFQVGFSSWWVGKFKDCRNIMFKLAEEYEDGKYDLIYKQQIQSNITRLGSGDEFVMYDKTQLGNYKYNFEGLDKIEKNYSQCFQDMFILTLLNGKNKGTYLEIGSADPFKGNNTYLLEKQYEWLGKGIEILQNEVSNYNNHRRNKSILANALEIDYDKLLGEMSQEYKTNNIFDYLQIDCEPPIISLEILKKIPLNKYAFRIITFEHDYYADLEKKVRKESREYLEKMGYMLVVGNVSMNENCPYEDWWINPNLINNTHYKKLLNSHSKVVNIKSHFIK